MPESAWYLPRLLKSLWPRREPNPIAPPAPESAISFRGGGDLTLGVELELQIIDAQSLELAPRAEELLKVLRGYDKAKPELYQDMIELNTGICADAHAAEADLAESLDMLIKAGENMGIGFASTATHPFSTYRESEIFPAERYKVLIDRNQWLTRRWKVYGLHVHIGMASGDDCIRFNNFLMQLLPHFLALSASGPYWHGRDTGLATCRPTTYEALPTAGLPYYVDSWEQFTQLCETLRRARAITSLKDLWWDVRPSPNFGTLEIRVCDSPATLAEALALVAFMHALCHWFRDHGDWLRQVPQPPHWLMRENKWRVIRHGLDAELVTRADGTNIPIRQDIANWIGKIAPYTDRLGYGDHVATLEEICARGCSSRRQRAIFAAEKSVKAVADFNRREFVARKALWDEAETRGVRTAAE